MNGPFTGRHMAIVMVTFFAIVVAVNIGMARVASSSFGGTVVDNSYVASQKFNGWLQAARDQRALGWRVAVSVDGDRHVRLATSLPDGAHVTGIAMHPLGRVKDQRLMFASAGNGGWRSTSPLPAGRFHVSIAVRAAGRQGAFAGEVPA